MSGEVDYRVGFDGRAILRGGKGLHWHGVALPEEVRLVPRALVGFPGDVGPLRRLLLRLWRRSLDLRWRLRGRP